MMNVEKMREIFSDKEFVKSLLGMENASEVQSALNEKHIELTEEEVLAICDFFSKVKSGEISSQQLRKQNENDELSEGTLETVAGGLSWGDVWQFILDVFYCAGGGDV